MVSVKDWIEIHPALLGVPQFRQLIDGEHPHGKQLMSWCFFMESPDSPFIVLPEAERMAQVDKLVPVKKVVKAKELEALREIFRSVVYNSMTSLMVTLLRKCHDVIEALNQKPTNLADLSEDVGLYANATKLITQIQELRFKIKKHESGDAKIVGGGTTGLYEE